MRSEDKPGRALLGKLQDGHRATGVAATRPAAEIVDVVRIGVNLPPADTIDKERRTDC